MEPLLIHQSDRLYWRLRRLRGLYPLRHRPGYFVDERHRPTRREVQTLVRNTVQYIAWRATIADDRYIEAHDCADLIERVRAGGWLVPDDSEMPQDDSEDSYGYFCSHGHKRTTNGEGIR